MGSALILASQQGQTLVGLGMLLCYSLGLGIPFVVSAVLIDQLKGAFNFIKQNYRVINLVCGGELSQTLGYLPLVGLIAVFLCVYMPRHFVGQAWKTQCRKYGEETERITYFYPDRLLITGEGVEKEVPYGDILGVKTTRNLLILVFRDNAALLLAKNGFRGITKDEIMARIKR